MKIGFVSLGCPKNLVDSEVMMGMLESRGHELTSDPSDAEALVVNTCSFIDPAKRRFIVSRSKVSSDIRATYLSMPQASIA